MIPKFFGQYLLQKGVLTKDQLIGAINFQKSKILKLGEIALQKGYLTQKEIDKIHTEQKRTDAMFGELAIKMDLLNETQLKEIVTIQQNSHIYLGQAIVMCGYLNQEQVDAELSLFKEEQKLVPPVEIVLSEEIENKDVVTIILDVTIKLLRRVADLFSKIGQPEKNKREIENTYITSTIEFSGGFAGKYALNLSRNISLEIAKKIYKKENLDFDNETIADTVNEFVNIICGNINAKLLEIGKKTEIHPPSYLMAEQCKILKYKPEEKVICVPFYTPIGNLSVIILT